MVEDILIRIKGEDQASGVFNKIKNSSAGMKMALGGAMTAVGVGMASLAKEAVSSAITAETEWNRFGAAVNSTGGNWEQQSTEIKKWVSNYSNAMGRSIGDTRSAMTALMDYGLSAKEAEQSLGAVSGMAAQLGISQEEASSKLIKAFAGQGRGLKQLGINLDDYKDKATGAIDKQRLLRDITNKTKDASSKYAGSTQADMNRINQAITNIKTDFGKALLTSIQPLLPVVQGLLNTFNNLPGPIKTILFSIGALAAVIGVVAGPITTVVGAVQSLKGAVSAVSSTMKVAETVTTALTSAELAAGAAKAGLTAEEIGSAAAHAGSTAAITAEAGATGLASTGFLAMAAAELAALAPIILVIAAIAAIIIIIEQLGEYMGWWSDWGSMIESFSSGIQRLWNAFVGSKVVQGYLSALRAEFNLIKSIVMPIISAVGAAWSGFMGMLGSGTNSDPVGGLISGFGKLDSMISGAVGAIRKLPQTLQQLPGKAKAAVMGMVTAFSSLVLKGAVYARQLVTRFVANLRSMPARVKMIFTRVLTMIRIWALQTIAKMKQTGVKMVTGLVNRLRQLPTKVWHFISQIPHKIAQVASSAVSAAISLATQVVNAVGNGIKGVAQKVYTEFMNIPKKIKSAVSSAVQAATSFGSDIKNAVLKALHIASPGIIQKKIALEFANIPGRIDESRPAVFRASQSYATGLLNGFSKPVTSNIHGFRQAGQTYNNPDYSRSTRSVVFHEGSIQINANNLSPNECKAIVINAIESLDSMKNSNIRGAH
jgi:phage-related protein